MKKEPCIRLGMRIRPKIREKPDDNRNKRPPKARLLVARMAACANVICVMNGLSPDPRNATTLDNHHARNPGSIQQDPGLADLQHNRRTVAAIPNTSPADSRAHRPAPPGTASRHRSRTG